MAVSFCKGFTMYGLYSLSQSISFSAYLFPVMVSLMLIYIPSLSAIVRCLTAFVHPEAEMKLHYTVWGYEALITTIVLQVQCIKIRICNPRLTLKYFDLVQPYYCKCFELIALRELGTNNVLMEDYKFNKLCLADDFIFQCAILWICIWMVNDFVRVNIASASSFVPSNRNQWPDPVFAYNK